MLIWRSDGVLTVTLQTDHMAQSADVARVWGRGDLLGPTRPAQAALAARLHDEPWGEQEVHPQIDPETGLPVDFNIYFFRSPSIPPERHSSFYSRGVDYAAQFDLYAALLISMHASGLYLRRYGIDGDPPVDRASIPEYGRNFAASEEARQAVYRQQLGVSQADIWRDYYLLQLWDRMSLFFCLGRSAEDLGLMPSASDPRGRRGRIRRLDQRTATVDPYPFPEPEVAFPVKSYRLPDRRYASSEDFVGQLAATAPQTIVYRVVAKG